MTKPTQKPAEKATADEIASADIVTPALDAAIKALADPADEQPAAPQTPEEIFAAAAEANRQARKAQADEAIEARKAIDPIDRFEVRDARPEDAPSDAFLAANKRIPSVYTEPAEIVESKTIDGFTIRENK
jgi:hypothetical protein